LVKADASFFLSQLTGTWNNESVIIDTVGLVEVCRVMYLLVPFRRLGFNRKRRERKGEKVLSHPLSRVE
jgi:hypothetical protein